MPYKAPGTVLIISELISFVNFVSLLDLGLHVVEIRLYYNQILVVYPLMSFYLACLKQSDLLLLIKREIINFRTDARYQK